MSFFNSLIFVYISVFAKQASYSSFTVISEVKCKCLYYYNDIYSDIYSMVQISVYNDAKEYSITLHCPGQLCFK